MNIYNQNTDTWIKFDLALIQAIQTDEKLPESKKDKMLFDARRMLVSDKNKKPKQAK